MSDAPHEVRAEAADVIFASWRVLTLVPPRVRYGY